MGISLYLIFQMQGYDLFFDALPQKDYILKILSHIGLKFNFSSTKHVPALFSPLCSSPLQ